METIVNTIEQPALEKGMDIMKEMFEPEVVTNSANLVERAFLEGLNGMEIPIELAGAAGGFIVGVILSGLVQLGYNKLMGEKQVPPLGCGCTVGTLLVPACTAVGFFIGMSQAK